jgi:hypothetical protein
MTAKLTPEKIELAREMRFTRGLTLKTIADRIGVSDTTIARALNPDKAETRRRLDAERDRQRRRAKATTLGNLSTGRGIVSGKSVDRDASARLAEIPPDTRTMTQALLGDPIPGDPRRPWLQGRSR